MRQVKGSLFVDYVKMLRGHKGVDWSRHLPPEDMALLAARIDVAAWYPMDSFERLGDQILHHVARGDLQAVRMWGRYSVDVLRAANPMLLAPDDPLETLNRFRVMRATFFDFPALDVLMLHDDEAELEVRFHMGATAEEAAAMQTLGFFERLLELAGARDILARFITRAWRDEPRTVLALHWQS
ncbi:MAG: hypothetical protein IPL61_25100 [Myxococcales bacterium]|nr:hypothetical protein [Myxococcales bacterium]